MCLVFKDSTTHWCVIRREILQLFVLTIRTLLHIDQIICTGSFECVTAIRQVKITCDGFSTRSVLEY